MHEDLKELLTGVETQSDALGKVEPAVSLLGLFTIFVTTTIITAQQLVEIKESLLRMEDKEN